MLLTQNNILTTTHNISQKAIISYLSRAIKWNLLKWKKTWEFRKKNHGKKEIKQTTKPTHKGNMKKNEQN